MEINNLPTTMETPRLRLDGNNVGSSTSIEVELKTNTKVTDDAESAEAAAAAKADTVEELPTTTQRPIPPSAASSSVSHGKQDGLAAQQLAQVYDGVFGPPLLEARSNLKELIAKQNKIYIDLLGEKFRLDNADMTTVGSMMNDVRVYKETLIRINKKMRNIYQRTKVMKKRVEHIQTHMQKEAQRKLLKQRQEEALIGTAAAAANSA